MEEQGDEGQKGNALTSYLNNGANVDVTDLTFNSSWAYVEVPNPVGCTSGSHPGAGLKWALKASRRVRTLA